MTKLDDLLTSDNEVGITISFSDFYVEVQRDGVTFYDPTKSREHGLLLSLSRDNFNDIITACEAIPASE